MNIDTLIVGGGQAGLATAHHLARAGRSAVLLEAGTAPVGSFADQRVVIVGGGNTAVHVAHELAQHARVTLATRRPITFANPNLLGRDLHWWFVRTGLDRLPLGPHLHGIPTAPVSDPGHYGPRGR
ncbi:FAD-dependent oxidoreductase [Ornithinimicrobium ciconiae]|uniref:FAD-dependent oxidoreductase n=1 Tax=Ornithinimicrobium ciconiae TaxID=2594265 RepID=UPI00192E1E97|nr:FAD-dependent oxidoreductase [Ornithinimicrobium ciconiae]